MPCLEEKERHAGKALRFITAKENIVFLKDIFESYDNIALLTTLNKHEALLQLTFHSSCEEIIEKILEDLVCYFSINISIIND